MITASLKLLCVSYSEHAGICLQLFIQQRFNWLLWTHHIFCLEHAVGYTFPPRTILPLRRLNVVAPTLPHWLQCWEYGGVTCWKAHFCLLNQSLVHFLLNLIDWFSLDRQFWEGEEGAVSHCCYLVLMNRNLLIILLHREAKSGPAALSAVSVLALRKKKTLRENNEETIREISRGSVL